jgi:type II secretory pathway component PulM
MILFWKSLAPLGRWVIGIGAALFLLAVLGGVTSCQMARTAKTEARLSKGQTGAALASGADAVEALGKSAAAEARIDTITEENERAIRQAPGAAVPVDPALHGAGLAGLCRRAAYRGRPECLQQPAP